MEEQSCVLLENGRRISAFASQLPFMRGTALTPDPSIKNRQAPCGACRFLVRAAGLEPARRMAMEPKSVESTNSTTPADMSGRAACRYFISLWFYTAREPRRSISLDPRL